MTSRAWLTGLLLAAATGPASADPATESLQHAVPAGWTVLATDTELVIRHDHAVFMAADAAHHDDGQRTELELRYRLEPRWPAPRLARARATNARLASDLAAARAQLRIDALPIARGAPQATTPDEHTRLDAFRKAEVAAAGKQVVLPTCTLGAHAVFDLPQTYAELAKQTDPPLAMTEAHQIAEIVKTRCVGQ